MLLGHVRTCVHARGTKLCAPITARSRVQSRNGVWLTVRARCLYTSLCRTVRVSGVCALPRCGRVSLALCRWRLSVPVARTAPPPPPHRLFSQNALQFIKQYWKMHGRPLFLVLIREDNIRYVEERGEA